MNTTVLDLARIRQLALDGLFVIGVVILLSMEMPF